MANTLTKDVILNLEISDSEAVTSIGKLIKRMDELKAQQIVLNSTINETNKKRREGAITEAEYLEKIEKTYSQIAKNKSEMKLTRDAMSAYQKELNNNIIKEKAASDSIEAMRAKLSNMRKTYEQLSKSERDNPLVGGKQLEDIAKLTSELSALEKQQGDFRRSVGNYPSMLDASSESITRFGSILANIFGGNGVIGKAATVVVGFGRSLKEMGKEASDMASTITDSAKRTQSGAEILETTSQTIGDVGTAADTASKTVQGFGKALYETETVEDGAAKATTEMAKATGGISGAFKTAGTAVKAFGKSLLGLLANPFVLAFSAIVVVLVKLANEFKKNDAAMTALQRVFAAFKPILDVINKGFGLLADTLGKAMNALSNGLQWIAQYIPVLRDYAKSEDEIVVATDNLEEAERQYTVNHAKRESEISELNAKSADSQQYSFAERKKFLEQALELEKEDLAENKANAEEKLRLRRKEMALNLGFAEFTEEVYEKMSDEMKNELADLEALVYGAEKAYNDGIRSINKRMSSFTKQEENERKQRNQNAANAAKERRKIEEETMDALEEMWLKSIANLNDREYALAAQSYRKQISALQKKLKEEKNLTAKAREAINRQIILMEADMQIQLGEIRKKQMEKNWQDELNGLKSYYERLLNNMTDEEAKVQISLEINKIDTTQLLDSLKKPLENAQKTLDEAIKDQTTLSAEELTTKYKDVWESLEIDDSVFKNPADKMKALVQKYNDDLLKEQAKYENNKNAVIRASEKETERIQNEALKNKKDRQDKEYTLAVKHQEILSKIEMENDLELYNSNEVEKAKIMQRAANERLKIAQDEYERLKEERNKYTDEELEYLYGSVEAYNVKLEEANLKVIESNNAVKQSFRDVTAAQIEEKKKLIDTVSSIADALNNVASGFQSLFSVLAEDNAKYSDFATAMAMTQILASAAVSTAQAVQAAVNAGMGTGMAAPATIPIFIAELIGIVTSSIASAISLLKEAKSSKSSTPKFAEGGLVGNRTTKKKDDKIDAKLSEGEYVIKSEIVSKYGVPFFDFLNYGKLVKPRSKTEYAEGGAVIPQSAIDRAETITMEDFKAAMTEALAEMPNPIVSVKEISNAQNRVSVKEKIARGE